MSKWDYELMTDDDARHILDPKADRSAESYGDRVKARRLLERRFSDHGVKIPPLRTFPRPKR